MDIIEATAQYEQWLGTHIDLLSSDLEFKHAQMAGSVFPFLRATFYRWAELWQEACPDLADAVQVLSVADLHVENFGTWRDAEGRLIWGINDFDEAFPLPWTFDLVRLATSARLAIDTENLSIKERAACDAILSGYASALESGGKPFVLAENHGWLRKIALGKLRSPVRFWDKLGALPTWDQPVMPAALEALHSMLPERELECRIAHRIAGLGSLGRHRFVALAEWRAGNVAREAKAMAPSACVWAMNPPTAQSHCHSIVTRAVRVPDPFVAVRGDWIVRRLAPDCARIELSDMPHSRDESRLLFSMGFEIGNIHCGTQGVRDAIRSDLKRRKGSWLHDAAKRMAATTRADWKTWRAHWAARERAPS